MSPYRLLDLFSGPGGAAAGYARAGFTVHGIDVEHYPEYPFTSSVFDVRDIDLGDPEWARFVASFDAIHASPPCQAHSVASNGAPRARLRPRIDLIPSTRALLEATGKPYVIENVVGAPLERPIELCGSSFGLGVRRHRLFEVNWPMKGTPCRHPDQEETITVAGNFSCSLQVAREAMGMDWGTRKSLPQAIPPAYTEFIGLQLVAHLDETRRTMPGAPLTLES